MTPIPLAPRRAASAPSRFHRGTHPPFAIRWFGASALVGHLRHLVAVAAASNQLDLRDWMRPDDPDTLAARIGRVLEAKGGGRTLTERLGRDVWIDFVADTGDDHDVSVAVARMVAAEYVTTSGEACTLPRGDLLVFGGDTAYPASTAPEIQRRLLRPWNRVLRARADEQPRVLLGIPGNHDWYDGLDGFGRLFRRSARRDDREPVGRQDPSRPADRVEPRTEGTIERHLHVDEVRESLRVAKDAVASVGAILAGSKVARERRLTLVGYTAVQESSYWALPLAPGLDLWGVDRQLRNADYRQRVFFAHARRATPDTRLMVVAPDPVFAYGEPNPPGQDILRSLNLSFKDGLLYLTGDVHHYERRSMDRSVHVIAGGGGAFLHGSRIDKRTGSEPPAVVHPDRTTSLRLALRMPWHLATGMGGFLPHGVFAAAAAVEMVALRRGPMLGGLVAAFFTAAAVFGLTLCIRARFNRPWATYAAALGFGPILGLGPLALRYAVPHLPVQFGDIAEVAIVHAFFGSFMLGLFLLVIALAGLEHHQGFAVLGHPGFRHFVRLHVNASGSVEAFVIGKDDPIGQGAPTLFDRFGWPEQN
jgi:hypothetical protein